MWHMRDSSIVLAIFFVVCAPSPSSHKHDLRTVVHQLRNSFVFYNPFDNEKNFIPTFFQPLVLAVRVCSSIFIYLFEIKFYSCSIRFNSFETSAAASCEWRKKELCLNTFSDFNQRFFSFSFSLFLSNFMFFLVWTFSRRLFRVFFHRFRESQRRKRERKKRNVLSIFFRPMVERSFSAVSWQSNDRYGLFMSEHNVPLCQRFG